MSDLLVITSHSHFDYEPFSHSLLFVALHCFRAGQIHSGDYNVNRQTFVQHTVLHWQRLLILDVNLGQRHYWREILS